MQVNDRQIQDQVKLPSRVAFGVVLQGIRIRFGRSLVTLSGVALGIAFLMSIFTGRIIKDGVSDEENIRIETEQMLGFLVAEMGPVADRSIGVIQTGAVNKVEKRLLGLIADKGGLINYATAGSQTMANDLPQSVVQVSLDDVADKASAIIIIGANDEKLAISWEESLAKARQKVIAPTRSQSRDQIVLDLTARTAGKIKDATIGVIQAGDLSQVESRYLASFLDLKPKTVKWALLDDQADVSGLDDRIQIVKRSQICDGADVVLVLGQVTAAGPGWDEIKPTPNQKVYAPVRRNVDIPLKGIASPSDVFKGVSLEREVTEQEIADIEASARKGRFRNIWIITISLLVTVIGISNAMLMSVTERFREIGTMKCLGALSSFIRQIFLIESSLVGLVGSTVGAIFGVIFSILMYCLTYNFSMVIRSLDIPELFGLLLLSIVIGSVLSVIAALYPAQFASRMVPATALRSNI
ncbi:MAG TPA: FtsX-like permease family protein [Phycisphaerae bacterium]|nr:FtsX-like permease family protein [Phycisphaerae bacterium]